MKRISYAILVLAIVGVSMFNIDNSTASAENKVSLSNIKALQASATEAGCDATTSNPCRIQMSNGLLIYGVGQPYIID